MPLNCKKKSAGCISSEYCYIYGAYHFQKLDHLSKYAILCIYYF